jgi:CheY-like chemotaxis protein
MSSNHRLLVVEPDSQAAAVVRDTLLSAGHGIVAVNSFEDAVRVLNDGGADLLITALRLGAFNGLHLVIRSRVLHPDVPTLVIADPTDRSSDIDRLGVRFLAKPVDTIDLSTTVAELLAQRGIPSTSLQRRWPRKHAHLPAKISDRQIEVIDLSYGGLRLEAPIPPAGGAPVTVNFPTLGLSITGVARWTKSLGNGSGSWCGVEILEGGADTTAAWRGVVDSIH